MACAVDRPPLRVVARSGDAVRLETSVAVMGEDSTDSGESLRAWVALGTCSAAAAMGVIWLRGERREGDKKAENSEA